MSSQAEPTNEIRTVSPGPIEGEFRLDLSKGPGLYELRGSRGSGKTTVLDAIDSLVPGHKVNITVHDGRPTAQVSGFGVVVPIGSRKRRKGELEVDAIDTERFTLQDLIDPPGKTPETRDAHRLKSLAALCGVDADKERYRALFEQPGGDGWLSLYEEIKESDDPILVANRTKSVLEQEARSLATQAEQEGRHAERLEVVPEGLDMSQESDVAKLDEQRTVARDAWVRACDSRKAGQAKQLEIEQAAARLEEVRKDYQGPTVEKAEADMVMCSQDVDAAQLIINDLEKKLSEAKSVLATKQVAEQIAEERLETARQHQEAIQALEQTASSESHYPTEEWLEHLKAEYDTASEQYDNGVRIRDVKENQNHAKAHRRSQTELLQESQELYGRAGRVYRTLAESLKTEHILIESVDGVPRLFVEHERRGRCLFDHVNGLSDGERVDASLKELLPRLQSPGMLVIPQRVHQDLQPSDRKRLHELAKERGIYAYGAQVDDLELRCVYYGDEEQAT